MSIRAKAPRVILLFLAFFLMAAMGIAAFSDLPGQVFSAFQKAFYLSVEDAVWIRPGLNVEIQDVSITAARKVVVRFKISDEKGQPLDRAGILTPGAVSSSFLIAYIPQNASQYVSYATRNQTSPITGVSATQATSDSGGTYVSIGDGIYTYTSGTTLPSNYDVTATHTVGIYATRNLQEFGLSFYVDNKIKNFVPNGSSVTKVRDVVPTSACNQCHDPLALHGSTGRRAVEICIMCHTPQSLDPDTGNTVDMKVMIHKIHMGANLPSVKAGKPYVIIGFNQSEHDYSHVEIPMDIRNCAHCHKDTAQVDNWFLNPTIATCGSCHDDVNFVTGQNHLGGAQSSDKFCANCHFPESDMEYDATIKGAHVPPTDSKQLLNPKIELLDVTNIGPGKAPTVKFKLTDKAGKVIDPKNMGRFGLTLAGPTSDYRWYIQESATGATMAADGVSTYSFTATLPADAKGTFAVEAEGYLNTKVNPGTLKEFTQRDAMVNQVKPFAVTGTVTPRRTVVDLANCNKCHHKLELHGSNRNQIEACVICHNPANTDAAVRPATAKPDRSIDFKHMIHRIHTGEELQGDYTVYGYRSAVHNYNHVVYPGDRRNCLACHKGSSHTVPLPAGVTPTTSPSLYWNPTLPTAAACLGCHDSIEAAAHAFLNTATFGESCSVCHKEAAEFGVTKVHAR